MDDDKIFNLRICHCYPLREHESYFNWVEGDFEEATAKDRIEKRRCVKKCSNIVECSYCCFDGDWRLQVEPMLFLDNEDDQLNRDKGHFQKFVSWNGEMIFLDAFIGEHQKAIDRLNYLNESIDCGEKHSMDVEGYKYITKTLLAFIRFCKMTLDRSEVESLQDFDKLNPQAQIAVLSVKLNFYKGIRDTVTAQIRILRKLVELDPTNPVWYERLGIHLRLLNKESLKYGQGIKPPNREQTKAFVTAYSLRPDIPKFFASLGRNIAEMLKHEMRIKSTDQSVRVDLDIKGQSIETCEDALNFLKKYTRFLLDASDDSNDFAKAITTMGEVFSVSMPQCYQDFDLAERCITTAIQIRPNCSKVNHRMGLFQLLKRKNYEGALEHLTAAVASKKENYYALTDWIQLLICQTDKSSTLLSEVFDEILSKSFSWTPCQTARIAFLKGCFNFIVKGKKKETMDLWLQAYETDGTSCHFLMSFKEARRFKWKGFDRYEILNLLTKSKFSSTPIVRKMINEIRKSKSNPHQQSNSNCNKI